LSPKPNPNRFTGDEGGAGGGKGHEAKHRHQHGRSRSTLMALSIYSWIRPFLENEHHQALRRRFCISASIFGCRATRALWLIGCRAKRCGLCRFQQVIRGHVGRCRHVYPGDDTRDTGCEPAPCMSNFFSRCALVICGQSLAKTRLARGIDLIKKAGLFL
jgi:hypothetical protein